ncbi:T9SS type A sorting domain-containing protein [Dawidia soli]|uniref:T9SS type A sorting domain-containing protein n=1 Tax=Dawidia soli TaxID=2782352 RepID=A0AAP2GG51_9BACT|nr:T9SS type A sorting domain-containing protein [Dawidia soli]MBT1690232.1 T9SS type A sorting domain-containing protein [Dawidia soli]
MKLFLSSLVILAAIGMSHAQPQYAKVHPGDSAVLANFNVAMQQHGWPPLWDNAKPAVTWPGVTFRAPEPYRVTGLSIVGNKLGNGDFTTPTLPAIVAMLKDLPLMESFGVHVGLQSLPAELAQLTQIQSLELANNRLSGLPPEVTRMANLTTLSLDNNTFSTLPDLSGLSKLTRLTASQNKDLAALPASFFSLTHLTYIDLGWGGLSSLPDDIQNLVNLEQLHVDVCKLTELPVGIGRLAKLHTLDASYNQLESLPEALGWATGLQQLNLRGNKLIALPATFAQLSALEGIDLRNNRLASFPSSIAALSRLQTIQASTNQMEGGLPAALWNRPATRPLSLEVSDNKLSGKIEIPNARSVRFLGLSGNRYRFTDLYEVYASLRAAGVTMVFNDQVRVGTARTIQPKQGDVVTIGIDGYVPLDGSVYTWYQRRTLNESARVVSQAQELRLPAVDLFEAAGIYHCMITHPELGDWRLYSNEVRLIGRNAPPVISVSDIIFRQGNTIPDLVISVTDDFSTADKITVAVPFETEHFILSPSSTGQGTTVYQLSLKAPAWAGTDTMIVLATDGEGHTSQRTFTITSLPAGNQAPVAGGLPVVYLLEEAIPCGTEPGCVPFWIWTAKCEIGRFITDDLDRTDQLMLTVDEEKAEALAEKDIFFVVFRESDNRWMLEVSHFNDTDTAFVSTITLHVADREGAVTDVPVTFSIPETSLVPPSIEPIPDQFATLGDHAFPLLDLERYVHHAHYSALDMAWRAYPMSSYLRVDMPSGSAAVAVPLAYEPRTDTIVYEAYPVMNTYVSRQVKVAYHVLPALYVAGVVHAASGEPLADVLIQGFPRGAVVTGPDGRFYAEVPEGWSGTIMPTAPGLKFFPASATVDNIQEPRTDLSFHAAVVTGLDAGEFPPIVSYPNPATTTLFVRSADDASVEAHLTSAVGRRFPLTKISGAEGEFSYSLENVVPGVYILTLSTKTRTINQKFTVVR